MNVEHAWRAIRGTDAERVLVAAEESGGLLTDDQAGRAVGDDWAATIAIARLRELGLTSPDEDYDEFRLSRDGRQLAQKIMQSRINGPERWDAVQRAMLHFIAEDQPDRAFDIVGSERGVVDGRAVTDAEARMAFAYLDEHDLAKPTFRSMGAPDLKPQVTIKGMYAMHEPNIREYVDRGFIGSTTYDYSTRNTVNGGNVGAMVSGQGNTANVVQHISHDERTQTLGLVDRVLSGLGDGAEDAPLRAKVEEIKAEAEAPSGSKHAILTKARDALLIATATEGGRSVIQWLGQIVTGLGG